MTRWRVSRSCKSCSLQVADAIKSKAQRKKFAELLVEGNIAGDLRRVGSRGRQRRAAGCLHPKAAAKPKRKAKSKRTPKATPRKPKTSARAARNHG